MATAAETLDWLRTFWDSFRQGKNSSDANTRSDGASHALVPRVSIFDELSLNDDQKTLEKHRIPVHHQRVPYPVEADDAFREQLQQLMETVSSDMAELSGTDRSVLDKMLSIFDYRLEGVSYETGGSGEGAIPFPMYARLQTALRLAERNGQAQLVYGDLSGIQKYIFDVSKLGVTGVAKKLRARSLRIALLTRMFADWLCLSHGGTPLQICMSAGGVFYLLLPPDAAIDRSLADVNGWLMTEYHCAISFHVGAKVYSVNDIEHEFSRVAEEVIDIARIRKEQAFRAALVQDGQWQTERFVLRDAPLGERCSHCQRHPIHRNGLCAMCDQDEKLGGLLPRTKWLRFRQDCAGDIVFANRTSVDLLTRPPEEIVSTEYAMCGLDVSDHHHPDIPVLWMNTHVPIAKEDCPHCTRSGGSDLKVRKGDVYSFSCISALGKGAAEPLGYLKADVDSMGLMFALGFMQENKQYASLYEYATLSQTLDRFFTYRLQQLLSTERPHIYSVFSGGDDLYLVGRASDILAFSLRMQEEFAKYTAHPEVTLSAGMAFVRPRHPLSKVTAEVEEFLERAKELPGWSRHCSDMGGRNQVSFHGVSFTWSEFRRLLTEARQMVQWLDDGSLSSGVLYRLDAAIRQLPRAQDDGWIRRTDAAVWRLLPKLSYEISRNLSQSPHVADWVRSHCWIRQDWTDDDWFIVQCWPALLYLVRLLRRENKP